MKEPARDGDFRPVKPVAIARDVLQRHRKFMRLDANARQIVDTMRTPGIDYRKSAKSRIAEAYALDKYDDATGNWRSGVDEAQYEILLEKFGEKRS